MTYASVCDGSGESINKGHYYNEISPYCCKVLRARIADGSLPAGFVDERDIRLVQPADLDGYTQCHFFAGIGGFPLGIKWAGAEHLPIWTGGFPCQDISMAGQRAGIEGERSGLWSEWFRLIRAVRPEIIIVENVSALLVPIDGNTPAPISRVLGDLDDGGFDAEWDVLPASAFGCPQNRERVFILAYHNSQRSKNGIYAGGEFDQKGREARLGQFRGMARPDSWRKAVSEYVRSDDGIPARVERLGSLGNAVVPQVVEAIARAIVNSIKSVEAV